MPYDAVAFGATVLCLFTFSIPSWKFKQNPKYNYFLHIIYFNNLFSQNIYLCNILFSFSYLSGHMLINLLQIWKNASS